MRSYDFLLLLHGQQLALIPGVLLLGIAVLILGLSTRIPAERETFRLIAILAAIVVGFIGLFFSFLGIQEWMDSGSLFW